MADFSNVSVQVDLDTGHATVNFTPTFSMTSLNEPRIVVFMVPVSKDGDTSEATLRAQAIANAKELLKSVE